MSLGVELKGDWAAAILMLTRSKKEIQRAMKKAIRKEAQYLRRKMVKRIGSKDLEKLSRNTLLTKKQGGSKPLIASAEYRNSLQVVELSAMSVFVGWPAHEKRSLQLAEIHENGITIVQRMTEKQRRFLHAKLPTRSGERKPSTGVIVIHIPARPVVKYVLEQEGPKSGERVLANLKDELKQTMLKGFGT